MVNNYLIDRTKSRQVNCAATSTIQYNMIGDTLVREHIYECVCVFGCGNIYRAILYCVVRKHCNLDIAFCLRLNLEHGVPLPSFNISARKQTPIKDPSLCVCVCACS